MKGNKVIRKFMGVHKNYYSWKNLMKACKKFDRLNVGGWYQSDYVLHCDNIDNAAILYDKSLIFNRLVKAIKWYNDYMKKLKKE